MRAEWPSLVCHWQLELLCEVDLLGMHGFDLVRQANIGRTEVTQLALMWQ